MTKQSNQDGAPRNARTRPWSALALVCVAIAVVLGVRGMRFLTPTCERDGCPELGALSHYSPPEPARIYDEKGNIVGQLPGPKRIVVSLEEIPRVVRDGYVAVEDRRFRQHDGVDPTSALRAFVRNLRNGRVAEGGSTITMQLARNLFEPDVARWNRFRRKLAEIRIAHMIERELDKDEILTMYLNQIYLGDGVYGVEAASRHYFGKPVARVTLREGALLIGLAKNPEGYDPRQDIAAANKRIATVLGVLEREKVVSPEEAKLARADHIVLSEDGSMPEWGKNAYYLSAVRRELQGILPDPAQRPGLRIYTGLDARAQAAAVDALLAQIHGVERGSVGGFRHPVPNDETLHPMDASPYLQGMVVAMDPATGLVTTLVGGRDFHHSEFDRAFQARRQPGSAFKPIVYAVALARGVRLSDRISTAPIRLSQPGSPDWEPSDQEPTGEVSIRTALVESSIGAAVRVGRRVGVQRVADLARQLGISTDIPPYPSVYLGAAEVIPAELVAAFAAFGNGGHRVDPHLITRVVDRDGVVVYRRREQPGGRVLDERVAFLLLDVMRDVVRVGTAWRASASALSFPAAGKTGTTNGSRDAWFVGLTPSLVAGVWLGFDTPKTIVPGGSGGNLAAPVWASFMRVANDGRKAVSSWEPPAGVQAIDVDPLTGVRVSSACPARAPTREFFLRGAEPTRACSRPAAKQVKKREEPRSAPEARRRPDNPPSPGVRPSTRAAPPAPGGVRPPGGAAPVEAQEPKPGDTLEAPGSPPDWPTTPDPGVRPDTSPGRQGAPAPVVRPDSSAGRPSAPPPAAPPTSPTAPPPDIGRPNGGVWR